MGACDWEASGTNEGLHSVHVFCLNTTAGDAAQKPVDRARAKYGPQMDLSTRRFFLRERFTFGQPLGRTRARQRFESDVEGPPSASRPQGPGKTDRDTDNR